MFLTDAYFQGTLYLPNLRTITPEPVGIGRMLVAVAENSLDWYIDKYEREFLVRLLGVDLYNAFVEGLQESDNEKWQRLRDKIYDTSGQYPYSAAANYVYWQIMRNGVTTTTMKGEVVPEQDYAKNASAQQKLVDAWNGMLPMIACIDAFLKAHPDDYGQYAKDCTCSAFQFKSVNTFGL